MDTLVVMPPLSLQKQSGIINIFVLHTCQIMVMYFEHSARHCYNDT